MNTRRRQTRLVALGNSCHRLDLVVLRGRCLEEFVLVGFSKGFQHFGHRLLAAVFPFLAVVGSIIQVLITGDSKDTTLFELFGQGNNVEIEKAHFTLVPELCGVFGGSALQKGTVVFKEELFVPFL